MELIDKAKLYDEISRLEKMAMDNANEKEQHLQAYLININSLNERTMMKYLVADFPTVEPPKGEWEECDWVEYDGHGECIHYSKEALRCSNCCNAFKKELLWKDNFCPNCGADMRKKE